MPFALLIIGIVLIVVAVRDTQDQFITLVKGDFSGPGNFTWWVIALLMIGSLGYITRLRPIADGLLVLILLALVLSRGRPDQPGGGFFKQFTDAISSIGKPSSGVNIGVTIP
jgi:hypothetical protein